MRLWYAIPRQGGSHCQRGGSHCREVLPAGDPPPPVDRITDTSKNITLVTTSVRPVTRWCHIRMEKYADYLTQFLQH